MSERRARIRVCGRVQGVGFRPFVYAVAQQLGLTGWVRNDQGGVWIEAQGAAIESLLDRLRRQLPPLARVDSVTVSDIAVLAEERSFCVIESDRQGPTRTEIGPDVAVCAQCLAELLDPGNRRFRYPFITCTHCGPRYTICSQLPYDRPQTSLASFPLCSLCAAEYRDPANRRFHAESTACPSCGPVLSTDPRQILSDLLAGKIVAIKGIGGYHLACDARNDETVRRLRLRKQREAQPFAVMVANLASAAAIAQIDAPSAQLLESKERPIVIVGLRPAHGLAESVAPGLGTVGLMLPYTPIHWLLFHAAAAEPADSGWLEQVCELCLVMTSANPHGDPLVCTEDEASAQLTEIADCIVSHDRPIQMRCDDSVMRVIDGAPSMIRRARAFVPEPIDLGVEQAPTLAVGAYLKNTVCVTRGREAFVSAHIGDLDGPATRRHFQASVDHLTRILDVKPERVVCDLHPDFASSQYAQGLGLPLLAVQHHRAHVMAVLAEHAQHGPALGLALDGYGYGDDGAAWGGELLCITGADCKRLGHLQPLPMPGGDRCARESWRCAAAALQLLGRGTEIGSRFASQAMASSVQQLLARQLAVSTSSLGRWFDAACGLAGLHWHADYEGQGPMALEALVSVPSIVADGWLIDHGQLSLLPLFARLAEPGIDRVEAAECFHGTLIAALGDWVCRTANATGIRLVALSGGCLLNRVLAEGLVATLRARGLKPLLARRLPPNDGAISLGQAAVAANDSVSWTKTRQSQGEPAR